MDLLPTARRRASRALSPVSEKVHSTALALLEMLDAQEGLPHPCLPEALEQLTVNATQLHHRGHPAHAESLLRRGLHSCEAAFGPSDPGVVKPLIAMGSYLHKDERPEEASKYFLRAISICDKHPRRLGACKGTLAAALAESLAEARLHREAADPRSNGELQFHYRITGHTAEHLYAYSCFSESSHSHQRDTGSEPDGSAGPSTPQTPGSGQSSRRSSLAEDAKGAEENQQHTATEGLRTDVELRMAKGWVDRQRKLIKSFTWSPDNEGQVAREVSARSQKVLEAEDLLLRGASTLEPVTPDQSFQAGAWSVDSTVMYDGLQADGPEQPASTAEMSRASPIVGKAAGWSVNMGPRACRSLFSPAVVGGGSPGLAERVAALHDSARELAISAVPSDLKECARRLLEIEATHEQTMQNFADALMAYVEPSNM